MKRTFAVLLPALVLAGAIIPNCSHAQTAVAANAPLPPATPYAVTARDADSQVWERTTYEKAPDGTIVAKEHHYIEMATGLNFKDPATGQWTESKEEIDVLPQGGAEAVQGQHQSYFPADIYDGVIKDVTPDGVQLQSRPIALGYFDGTTTVFIAAITNSIGVLVSSNQVLYSSAFVGVDADLLYTYTRAGLEQDVILRSQPPVPEAFGLLSRNSRLQVTTEFFNAPQPKVTAGLAGGLPDENLNFGVTAMVPGKAFLMGTNAPAVAVGKQWVNLEGRQFLIEEIPVAGVAAELDSLPLTAKNDVKSASGISRSRGDEAQKLQAGTVLADKTSLLTSAPTKKNSQMASRQLVLPPQRIAKNVPAARPMQLASASLPDHGLVLDYVTLNHSTNYFTFQDGTTYYISGNVGLTWTNSIEGGAVIKFTNGLAFGLNASGVRLLTFATAPDRMAVLTSKDDDSVGEEINGSTHSPANTGSTYLILPTSPGAVPALAHVRFAYAGTAVYQQSGGASYTGIAAVEDCRFLNCAIGINDAPYDDYNTLDQQLFNVLFSHCGAAVTNSEAVQYADGYGGGMIISCRNVTADTVTNLLATGINDVSAADSTLTNCILTAVTHQIYRAENYTSTNFSYTNDCYITNGNAGVYAGGPLGNYYLPTNSPLIDAGNGTAAAAGLAAYTTQTNQSFDAGTVDLGYHYTIISSVGTDFWLAFYYADVGGSPNLSLYISSPAGAGGTVTIPGLGFTNTFTVAAGAVTNMAIPVAAMISSASDVITTNGIHITASAPVSAYGVYYYHQASTAFTGYPTAMLGTNYCILARETSSTPDEDYPLTDSSQLAVVAVEDNTTVTITPSETSDPYYDEYDYGNTPYTINLDQGETYQVSSVAYNDDVTGTMIQSDKPVGVYAGAYDAWVPNVGYAASNPLVQEQLPVEDWGTQALSMPFAGRLNGDTYRVLACTNATVTITNSFGVSIVTNLTAGTFCETNLDGWVWFQSTGPIQVAKFGNGEAFDNAPDGDPCEILLPPTGHYLETNVIVTLPTNNVTGDFDKNYLNLIVPQSATNSTSVDGSLVAFTNFTAIGTSGYYGTQITITNSGAHIVGSSQPVGVEVYGWGGNDAYGYFGGIVK